MNTITLPERTIRFLKSDDGIELLAALNHQFETDQPCYRHGDPDQTAFRSGQRDLVLELNRAAGYDPHGCKAQSPDQQLADVIKLDQSRGIEDLKA